MPLSNEECMARFIESKGLDKEYEEFKKVKEAEHNAAQKKVSVGDLEFAFYGHLSRYCYECSGEDFDHGGDLNYILNDFFDFYHYDPNTNDKYDIKEYKENPEKYKPITEILTEKEIDKVFNKLMKFINQENETFDYYLCDEFGFTDRVPTTEEIKEWFKTLLYETHNVEEAKDEILSNDFERTF